MGLFGSNKKEENQELPPLQFPELPKTVPAYEPRRAQPQKPISQPAMPVRHELPSMHGTEQPLFVRIEKYKDVVETLGKLKTRLGEAENILNKLNRLKNEEDRELAAWNQDLERIKNQLMNIDKQLFE
ncbi:MAG: hypothetical protein ABIJ18_00930 [archaeon]